MTVVPASHVAPARQSCVHDLARHLRRVVTGDVRFDPLYREIYATDASIYEATPLGVVLPRTIEDVLETLKLCRRHGTSLIARGAGTGLTGGAVGPGVQLDLSRHMTFIGPVNPRNRTVRVAPGAVLDHVNVQAARYGLQFAPDVATSSRATIGGMIANNSCGAHSILYGTTVDHVRDVTIVTGEGRIATFTAADALARRNVAAAPYGAAEGDSTDDIVTTLARLRDEHWTNICQRYPKIHRSNAGYGLDRLGPPGTQPNPLGIICGSEGTLGIVVAATLQLIPLPRCRGLLLLHYRNVLDSLAHLPALLAHQPAAIELIDHLVIEAGRRSPSVRGPCDFLVGNPAAVLIVELLDDDPKILNKRLLALASDPQATTGSYACIPVTDADHQQAVWNLRKSGLGLLMSRPGDEQPYAFVEDTAVAAEKLREYIARFQNIIQAEGTRAAFYAHAGAGCLHVRPILNLKKSQDVDRLARIAQAVADLAVEFHGTVTGEHGDGIARSCFLEQLYGAEIIHAMRRMKRLFDPDNVLNPHKILDPWPMHERLRRWPASQIEPTGTYLDFAEHGGLGGMAAMCSGVGQCRQSLTGTMCPSYVATRDERDTTRARANALRIALSDRGLLHGLSDPQLHEVMDLCIGCKACKGECPTGVDMAKMKAEYLSHRNLAEGVSRRSRFLADVPIRLARASRHPRVANGIAGSRLARRFLEQWFGLDRRIPPPRLARRTFHDWFRKRRVPCDPDGFPNGAVLYFVDTWTNYLQPEVAIAAVRLLERAGYRVLCPRLHCCGRPAISQGLLTEATELARQNIRILAEQFDAAVPIVGTEPSCILTLVDEYPQLVRTESARSIAQRCWTIEAFLHRLLTEDPNALSVKPSEVPLLYHAHCQQKAIVGTEPARALLRHVWGDQARLLDAGCCGMAGSFGHEVEHYEVARAIGEDRLFPAIRNRGAAVVAVSGYSCRTQIAHHTGVFPRHLVELLADSLDPIPL